MTFEWESCSYLIFSYYIYRRECSRPKHVSERNESISPFSTESSLSDSPDHSESEESSDAQITRKTVSTAIHSSDNLDTTEMNSTVCTLMKNSENSGHLDFMSKACTVMKGVHQALLNSNTTGYTNPEDLNFHHIIKKAQAEIESLVKVGQQTTHDQVEMEAAIKMSREILEQLNLMDREKGNTDNKTINCLQNQAGSHTKISEELKTNISKISPTRQKSDLKNNKIFENKVSNVSIKEHTEISSIVKYTAGFRILNNQWLQKRFLKRIGNFTSNQHIRQFTPILKIDRIDPDSPVILKYLERKKMNKKRFSCRQCKSLDHLCSCSCKENDTVNNSALNQPALESCPLITTNAADIPPTKLIPTIQADILTPINTHEINHNATTLINKNLPDAPIAHQFTNEYLPKTNKETMALPELQRHSVSAPLYKQSPLDLTCSKRHSANNKIWPKHEQHLLKLPNIGRRVKVCLEKNISNINLYSLPNSMPNIRQDPRCLLNLKNNRSSNDDCKIRKQMSPEYNCEETPKSYAEWKHYKKSLVQNSTKTMDVIPTAVAMNYTTHNKNVVNEVKNKIRCISDYINVKVRLAERQSSRESPDENPIQTLNDARPVSTNVPSEEDFPLLVRKHQLDFMSEIISDDNIHPDNSPQSIRKTHIHDKKKRHSHNNIIEDNTPYRCTSNKKITRTEHERDRRKSKEYHKEQFPMRQHISHEKHIHSHARRYRVRKKHSRNNIENTPNTYQREQRDFNEKHNNGVNIGTSMINTTCNIMEHSQKASISEEAMTICDVPFSERVTRLTVDNEGKSETLDNSKYMTSLASLEYENCINTSETSPDHTHTGDVSENKDLESTDIGENKFETPVGTHKDKSIESMDSGENKSIESMDGDENKFSESIDAEEHISSESIVGHENTSAESIVRDKNKSAESIDDDDEHISSESIVGDENKSAESIDDDEHISSESIVGEENKSAESIVDNEHISSESIVGEENKATESIVRDESKPAESIDADEHTSSESIVGYENKSAESIVRDENKSAESIDDGEHISSESIAGDENKSAESIDGDEHTSSESIVGYENKSSESIVRDENISAQSIDDDENNARQMEVDLYPGVTELTNDKLAITSPRTPPPAGLKIRLHSPVVIDSLFELPSADQIDVEKSSGSNEDNDVILISYAFKSKSSVSVKSEFVQNNGTVRNTKSANTTLDNENNNRCNLNTNINSMASGGLNYIDEDVLDPIEETCSPPVDENEIEPLVIAPIEEDQVYFIL